MRLHHLEITAFGPFADTVEVDFDALSDAGLFLLTGATGAGKTSVLDAVCFALYGNVPGDRGTAKRLRADQAEPGVEPRVVLETTVSGRRFRIARSPAWERPKRRGTGLTTQQAAVTIAERVDEQWHTLSTRLDETGHLVTGLVGMNLDQFCQVAMLPQGRFQAFLRARSEERHHLLQQLFRTGRFEAVERWLGDHRRTLRRTSLQHQATVAGLVNRVSEAAGVAPGDWDPESLDQPAATGVVETWADDLRAAAVAAAVAVRTALDAVETAAAAAADVLAHGRRLAEQQARWTAAQERRAVVEAEGAEHRAAALRLDAGARAARVLPVTDLADRAARSARDTAATAAAALATTTALGVLPERLAAARDQALTGAAAARALRPREETLVALRAGLETYAARIDRLNEEARRHSRELAQLPVRVGATRRDHATASTAVASLPAAEAALVRLREQHDALTQVGLLRPRLGAARKTLLEATDEVRRLKDVWLDLRERRLDGMAAEMAVGLEVGGCCPVCGSAEHPQPARAAHGAPDAATERGARRRVDDAEATVLLQDGLVRDLTTRIALAEQLAGPDSEQLPDRLAGAEQQVATLAPRAATAPQLEAELRRLEEHADDLHERVEAARLERVGVVSAQHAGRAEVAAVTDEIAALLGEGDDPDLATRAERLAIVAEACGAALDAQAAAAAAAAEGGRAASALAAALADAGFADAAEARAAAVPPAEAERLTRALRSHEAARDAVRQVLDDDALALAAARSAPDLPALAADDTACRDTLSARDAGSRVASGRDDRLAGLHTDLVAALRAWAPVRTEHELVTGLAAMVEGRSADNQFQMRLSAYVLAYRLSQVVDAANDRLARMSDQRYSLVHTGRRGAGENRGGLSLLVRDDWSGEDRDPATLSGGETFVVSLALALGLADVITDESDSAATGDSRLATLFVDEGFGSLDADTLDDVMDTLDSLREGGRVVGVVSHVAEMKDRIPTQLLVTKSRRGSQVRSTAGVLGSGA
ncbi:MAG: SMC family ATPase [Nocardioides sp.]